MKKIVGILMLTIILLTTSVFAAFPEDGEDVTNYDGLIDLISAEPMVQADMIEDDVYQIEQVVTIQDKVIDGNVYVIAKELNLNGATIYGDVYVMAETVKIENAEIRGSIYAIGEKMAVSGNINDVYAIGNSVVLKEDSNIWRNARVISNSLNVEGKIIRNLSATVQTLNIADTAAINGNLNYSSKTQGNISENAQVGNVQFEQLKEEEGYEKEDGDYLFEVVCMAFKTLIVALIIVFFVGKFKALPRENVASDLLKSMGKGLGVLILVPVLAIVLMFSVIGSALGVSVLAIYGVMLYVAISVLSVEIAYRILAKGGQESSSSLKIIGLSMLVSILIDVIGFLPVAGGVVRFIVILMGLGVLFDSMFKRIKSQSKSGDVNEN